MKFKIKNKTTIEACTNESVEELSKYKKDDLIEIEIIKPQRTLQQNKYLWKVFRILSDETGYSKEEIKNRILIDIGHYEDFIDEETGRVYTVIKATRNLNKKEFSELTENVLKWAAERGFYIMTPEEYFQNLT